MSNDEEMPLTPDEKRSLRGLMNDIGGVMDLTFNNNPNNPKTGWCVLVFGFDKPGIANYISNAKRESMIKALRETADRLERNEDNPR